ncbi:cytochrome b5 reductase 4 [Conger conger]|uniref:cytochrome b5 reductase 4 n=1 Tax=Conger conger TaxID=82655 RepID=UPI002A59D25A|nr:cytochrome b5 reductase 4 [Conger conger]XP_061074643.1 cytochrome b5 reductase 4 [Conger conger]
MLNVPSQSFPAPSSQQRVAPSGRNKVSLKPGRSLMDWIRFSKSGRDLTGLRGRLIEVTEEELRKHNTPADCWTCIRGMVYNVSPYMEYHPGGEDELMRAAGTDGTDLFDQVHRWVNYESMLKECLVGRMAVKASTSIKAQLSTDKQTSPVNGLPPAFPTLVLKPPSSAALPKPLPPPTPKDTRPRFDWFQTEAMVNVVVYTKRKIPNSGCAVVDLQGGTLRVEVVLGKLSYLLHLRLSQEVEECIAMQTMSTVGKVQVSLRKATRAKWDRLGEPLQSHDSFLRRKDRGVFYRECTLASKMDVTHDTRLFGLRLPHGTHMQVPVGRHVYLRAPIQGSEVVKPYTPVDSTLMSQSLASTEREHANVFLMIKIYPDGALTPHLDALNIGDSLSISGPEGPFTSRLLCEVTHLFLLAAGTGFTPMARLIRLSLLDLAPLRKAKLLFFNRKERDILWRSELDTLAGREERFEVEYVLSEPSDGWSGHRGRIEATMLSDFLSSPEGSKRLVCVCGPAAFTVLAQGMVCELGFSEEEIHAFQG